MLVSLHGFMTENFRSFFTLVLVIKFQVMQEIEQEGFVFLADLVF